LQLFIFIYLWITFSNPIIIFFHQLLPEWPSSGLPYTYMLKARGEMENGESPQGA